MQVANPIYDVVFKYLLDDQKVAKLLLSALLKTEIEEISYEATEGKAKVEGERVDNATEPEKVKAPAAGDFIKVLRMDFRARLRLADGAQRLVIIEIQKARAPWDLQRFRRYLGTQYLDDTHQFKDADGRNFPLPIISIYFLGESLGFTDASVIRVDRNYWDDITGQEITKKDHFIEGLTHDCHIVQIPHLKARRRNTVEQLLSIFDQSRSIGHKHQIDILETEIPEGYQEILRRLQRAYAEPEVRNTMDIEDEVVNALLEKDRQLEEKDRQLEEKDRALEEERRKSEAKERALEEQARQLAEQAKLIDELMRKTGEKEN